VASFRQFLTNSVLTNSVRTSGAFKLSRLSTIVSPFLVAAALTVVNAAGLPTPRRGHAAPAWPRSERVERLRARRHGSSSDRPAARQPRAASYAANYTLPPSPFNHS